MSADFFWRETSPRVGREKDARRSQPCLVERESKNLVCMLAAACAYIYVCVCINRLKDGRPVCIGLYIYTSWCCVYKLSRCELAKAERVSAPAPQKFYSQGKCAACALLWRRKRRAVCGVYIFWMRASDALNGANPNRTHCGQCSGEGRLIYDLALVNSDQNSLAQCSQWHCGEGIKLFAWSRQKMIGGHIFRFLWALICTCWK